MNKEIELKAWADEPENIKNKLSELYGIPVAIKKDDIYYKYMSAGSGQGQAVRLRAENGNNVVTLKKKSVTNGVEMNDELEFSVDNGDKFLQFMKLSGAEEWLSKKKSGWKFSTVTDSGKALIELCEVSELGWFIEIEIVLDEPDAQQIENAKKQLFAVLHSAGVSKDRIESKFYSDMLLEKRISSKG